MELKQRISLDDIYAIGLLIVPYGIETLPTGYNINGEILLIVPYGIKWHSYMCRQVIWGFYCMELKLVKLSCYFIYYDYLIM